MFCALLGVEGKKPNPLQSIYKIYFLYADINQIFIFNEFDCIKLRLNEVVGLINIMNKYLNEMEKYSFDINPQCGRNQQGRLENS